MPEIVAVTAVHPMPDGEVRLLGAVDCVTGAMTRVELGGRRLLVDCGIGQGREARNFVFPDAARDVDAVVLTHGHLDHIGSLPHLLDGGFDKPILATQATLAIARISLEDTLSMQRASFRETNALLAAFDRLARPVPYDGLHRLDGLELTFREAGHILGSASVDLCSGQSRVILSGDLGRPNAPLLKDAFSGWPAGRPVDLVVMESTYGEREHAHGHHDIEKKLREVVTQTVARQGKLFIPAFAIGRTQVVLFFLNHLVEAGKIPKVPVALDTPMGLLVTDTYSKFEKLYDAESLAMIARGDAPLDFESLYASRRGSDSARLRDAPSPMIIIAGSGMLTGGRIVNHLVDGGLEDERNTLLFAGHQGAGTPGRRIQDAAKQSGSVWLDGQEVPVRCRIDTLQGLSAHADRKELAAWLGKIPQVRRVALHHGEISAQRALVRFLDGAA